MPIYVITDVIFIPTTSQDEARNAIRQGKQGYGAEKGGLEVIHSDSELSEDEPEENLHSNQHDDNTSVGTIESSPDTAQATGVSGKDEQKTTTIAEDVIGKKGQYGMFADRWFSKKGWTAERRKSQGMSPDAVKSNPRASSELDAGGGVEPDSRILPDRPASKTVTNTLLPKLLRTTRLLFQSRSFFYAFDLDITRRLEKSKPRANEVALCNLVDPLVGWTNTRAMMQADKRAVLLEPSLNDTFGRCGTS